MRNYCIQNTKWQNSGSELDEIVNNIKKSEKIILYGDKKGVDEYLSENITKTQFLVEGGICYSDGTQSSASKLDVIETKEVPMNAVIICVERERKKYIQAKELFEQMGYKENETFFQGEVINKILDLYENSRLVVDRIEIFLTSYCTLNCEKCIAYIPYFKKKFHTPLELLKKDLDILFAGGIDYINKLKLLGGEVFLYPDLTEYLEYLFKNYSDKFKEVRVGTNGTIFPKDDILMVLKKYDVIVDISDYTKAVPDRCRLEEVAEYLKNAGIRYDIKRTGEHWLDMGFPEFTRVGENEEQIEEHFHKCAMFCRNFYDGKLWFCCSNFAAVQSGLFPPNENDYFDLQKEYSKKELLEYEIGYSKLGYTTFCEVCQGCSDEANHHFVEPAKQCGR